MYFSYILALNIVQNWSVEDLGGIPYYNNSIAYWEAQADCSMKPIINL